MHSRLAPPDYGVAGSQRVEKGGWLGHGGRTAPSAATKEVGWRITGQENRVERKETGSRQHGVIDNGDCHL